MLVLKHGNLGEIKRFRCPRCGCVFLAHSYEYGRGLENGCICKCPECGSTAGEETDDE